MLKQDVSGGEPGTRPLESFPASSRSENGQIHAQIEHKRGTGELGDFAVSVRDKNENEIVSCSTLQVPASSPTFPVSRSDENHAHIASDINGKPGGNIEGRASTCSPLSELTPIHIEERSVSLDTISNFFYDDPNMSYAPLPEHELDQSPCYLIIAKKQDYFYCRLHPDIRNVHLESIEHRIRYKDPKRHKSELLKLSKLTHS